MKESCISLYSIKKGSGKKRNLLLPLISYRVSFHDLYGTLRNPSFQLSDLLLPDQNKFKSVYTRQYNKNCFFICFYLHQFIFKKIISKNTTIFFLYIASTYCFTFFLISSPYISTSLSSFSESILKRASKTLFCILAAYSISSLKFA